MPSCSICTAVARPLKPAPMMTTWKPSGSSGLPSVQLGHQRERLERRELAARHELEVAHGLLGGHVHEHAQLGFGRLLERGRAGVVDEPRDGLVDQQRALVVVELERHGQRGELGVTRVLVRARPARR